MVGNNVSHSKRRTKRTFQPNLFDKKFYLEEEDRYVNLRVSAQAMRTINKNGLKATLDDAVKKGFLKSYYENRKWLTKVKETGYRLF